jgi:hypothetical protein
MKEFPNLKNSVLPICKRCASNTSQLWNVVSPVTKEFFDAKARQSLPNLAKRLPNACKTPLTIFPSLYQGLKVMLEFTTLCGMRSDSSQCGMRIDHLRVQGSEGYLRSKNYAYTGRTSFIYSLVSFLNLYVIAGTQFSQRWRHF